jgi:hypothetical protein
MSEIKSDLGFSPPSRDPADRGLLTEALGTEEADASLCDHNAVEGAPWQLHPSADERCERATGRRGLAW